MTGDSGGDAAAANRRVIELASRREVHQAFAWMHLHEPQIRHWQNEFLAIPAPTFAEAERARWFSERFEELGLEDVRIDEAGNALGVLPALAQGGSGSPADGRVLLVSAHLDTVFPPGVATGPVDDGERIAGPGASDNGAGLAALLAIAAACINAGVRAAVPILFAANTGEEGEGDLRGMRHLFGEGPFAGRIGTAVALEGAGTGLVVDRALGSRRLRISVRGPGGHSWTDAGQPNPILALAEGLLALEALELPRQPRTTLTCGTIAGGTSVNSMPAHAEATLDLRSTSAMELDRLEWSVVRALENGFASYNRQRGAAEPLRWRAERIGDRPAATLATDASLYRSLRAVDRHLRIATEPRIGSTDANWPLSLGVPALAVGSGGTGGGVHTLDEWFAPAGRDLALRRVLLMMLDAAAMLDEQPEIHS